MKKFVKIFMFLLVLTLVGYFGYTKIFKNDNKKEVNEETKEVKKLKIFDEDSNERAVAVMINNNHNAWPHASLEDSFLNYEIIVEGGITRIMAIFKGVDRIPEKVGSIRSARPYFLDYALENDAIYVHWGGSEEAYSNMDSLNMDHIDGIKYEGNYFYRDRDYNRAYEHTGFTKGTMIKEAVSDLGIRNTTEKDTVLNYTTDEVNLKDMERAIKADEIEIVYSSYQTTSYKYDEESKTYLRYMSDEEHVDSVTNKQYTAKNIITYKLQNISLDEADRQKLYNITKIEGYYITNGYAVPIIVEKTERSKKTTYKYLNGEEIKVNDGNTWIQIQPMGKYLGIESKEVETSNNQEFEE